MLAGYITSVHKIHVLCIAYTPYVDYKYTVMYILLQLSKHPSSARSRGVQISEDTLYLFLFTVYTCGYHGSQLGMQIGVQVKSCAATITIT